MVSATKELERKVPRRAPVRPADPEQARAADIREAERRQARIDAFFDGCEPVFVLEGSAGAEA